MRYDYDLFVIGAGSGGVRAARMAAASGARVAIAEEDRVGGTCVIRGCVPKKLFVYASHFGELFEEAAGFGWTLGEASFDWPTLKANKDAEIARLESIYRRNLERAGAQLIETRAELAGPHQVRLDAEDRHVTSERILIATGGRANPHRALPGHELCLTSREAFELERLPERIIVEGGGYIALEFAGIFHGLGVKTTIVYRGMEVLSRFDNDLRRLIHSSYEERGIAIKCHQVLERVERTSAGLHVSLSGGDAMDTDAVMLAVGRLPNTDGLGLDTVNLETDRKGAIPVDAYSKTSVDHIWAIGDVTDRMQLTPVAIHEAMCFYETEFRGNPTRPDYGTIPTAVFSQPEIGTVGLAEDAARASHANLDIYRSTFRPMKHTLSGRAEKMLMKLVVDADSDRILGAHVLGEGAGEMAQLLGISLKMGATKADFDATMAVHPTSAEELVTMAEPAVRIRAGRTVAA